MNAAVVLVWIFNKILILCFLDSNPTFKLIKFKFHFILSELCPKPNDTNRNGLALESLVGPLDAVPDLYRAITAGPDDEEKWTIFSFPVDLDASVYGIKMDHDFNMNIRKYYNFLTP